MKKRIEKIIAWIAVIILAALFVITCVVLFYAVAGYQIRVLNYFNQLP